MLGMIQQLYAIEKAAKLMTAALRKDLRLSAAQPILERIKLWLDHAGSSGTVLPRSPMGQAITYALNQWPALCIYISDGRLSIDNNAAERSLRRVAVGRKNWLWAGTDEAAMGHAVLWSLIASAHSQPPSPSRSNPLSGKLHPRQLRRPDAFDRTLTNDPATLCRGEDG